jgi:hypothetical protein
MLEGTYSCIDALAAKHKPVLALGLLKPCRNSPQFIKDYETTTRFCFRTFSALAAALAVELLDALEELILSLDALYNSLICKDYSTINPRYSVAQRVPTC